MSGRLIDKLVDDFDEDEAVDLMCELIDSNLLINRLLSMKLVNKLIGKLEKNRSYSYMHLGVSVYLKSSTEAFSIYLLDRLFLHVGSATPDELMQYAIAINCLLEAKPSISTRASMVAAVRTLESRFTSEDIQR
jgi:hypothetical protein